MSEPRTDAFIDFVEPITYVHFARQVSVYLVDASVLGHDWAVTKNPDAKLSSHAFVLHLHSINTLRELDLSELVPADEVVHHSSLFGSYDQWIDDWLRVRATPEGDSVLIEVGLGQAYSNADTPWDVSDADVHGRARCHVDAWRRALADARSCALEVADTLDALDSAGVDAPWDLWAKHPVSEIRDRVAGHPNTPPEILIDFASNHEYVWRLLGRDDLSAVAIEHLMGHDNPPENLKRIASHPNTPPHVLEDLAKRGARAYAHSTLSKSASIASARLAELAIASTSHIDLVFGELRAQVNAEPSEHAWASINRTIEAGLARDPVRVAEVWISYARERMERWRAFDCSVSRTDIAAWASGAPPRPTWGICKRLMLDEGHLTPSDDTWRLLEASPFLEGIEILAICQPPTLASLEVVSRLELPSLRQLIMTLWADERPPTRFALDRYAQTPWIEGLEELTLSHIDATPGEIATLLDAAPSLDWLSLHHLPLGPRHGECLARSGALQTMRHLNLNDAPTANIITSLSTHELPRLYHLSLSNSGFDDAHLRALCQSSWTPDLSELYLTDNPDLTDITPLLEIADQMGDHTMLRLERCSVPADQVAELESMLPTANILA